MHVMNEQRENAAEKMPTPEQLVARQVRLLRQGRGWSQQEVADLLNRNRINMHELREIGFDRNTPPEQLASFLQKEGRHAVAHANKDPTINPDDTGQQRQMSVAASILRAAARSCIKSQFRIGENRWDQNDLR